MSKPARQRLPVPLFFIAGALSQYLGAALAVHLFSRLQPETVAWLRVAFSAAFLLAWRRPFGERLPRPRKRGIVSFGVSLAAMNLCFYLAVARLPLGTAVAIEFAGPIAVATFGLRSARNVATLGLAAIGILALADVRWATSGTGVLFALSAAALWAAYILLGARLARQNAPTPAERLDALAWALVVGALAITPVGLIGLRGSNPTWPLVAGCAAVGVLSNVIPYALDQLVLPSLAPAQFALLLSLLPATASVVGAVVLGQIPTLVETLGTGAIVAAMLLRRERRIGPD